MILFHLIRRLPFITFSKIRCRVSVHPNLLQVRCSQNSNPPHKAYDKLTFLLMKFYMQVLRRDRQPSYTLMAPQSLGILIQKSNNKNKISIVTFFPYSIIGSYHVVHSCLWAPALIVSDVCTCMIHDLCAKMRRRKVERRIMRIWSRTLFSGMEDNNITTIMLRACLTHLCSVVTGLLYHLT